MSIFKACSFIIALLFILPVQAKRVALVMGNDNYTSVSKLQKAGNYDTSFDAYSACRNVADAFSPAVQELLRQVVTNPQFTLLVK